MKAIEDKCISRSGSASRASLFPALAAPERHCALAPPTVARRLPSLLDGLPLVDLMAVLGMLALALGAR